MIYLEKHWSTLQDIARARDSQKASFSSTKNWSIKNSTHFVGVCGEKIFSIIFNLPMDEQLRIQGDPGYDFVVNDKTYDIKTSTYWFSPDLKEFPNRKSWADVYVLAALNMSKKAGRLVGWVTQDQLKNAKTKNYGHGPMLSVSEAELIALNQTRLSI